MKILKKENNMRLEKQIRRILREQLLKESYIEPPKREIDKSGVLLDLIISNIDNYKKNETKYYNALIDFKNYFKILDENGKPNYVSVGIYNDSDDRGAARMDTVNNNLLINVSKWDDENGMDLTYFEDLITHELVHSMDKLVQDKNLYDAYFEKKGSEITGSTFNLSKVPNSKSEYEKNYEKYRNSQHEYNAELTPLITQIKKIVKNDEYKTKLIFWVIEHVKNYSKASDLFYETKEHFGDGSNRMFNSEESYWRFIYNLFNVVKPWTNRPTLYKKFINDLYLGINS
jgi:hypothetical protein